MSRARGWSANDEEFGYRIYRFDRPLRAGRDRSLTFRARASGTAVSARPPATPTSSRTAPSLNNFDFAPSIGMNRNGLLSDRTQRRRQGLPAELRPAKLEDLSATGAQLHRSATG